MYIVQLCSSIPTYFSFSTSDFTASEDGLFTDLPFTAVSMEGQDKNENMFEALEINWESRPYFPHFMFYVCLAIIKKNTFEATKGSLISERILTLPKKGTNSLPWTENLNKLFTVKD